MKIPIKDKSNTQYFYEGDTSLFFIPEKSGYAIPVIVKLRRYLLPGSSELNELDNEYVITNNLQISGVRKALEKTTVQGKEALVLEYIDGETLKNAFDKYQPELLDIFKIAISITKILNALHQKGIIHKNISSSNILIDKTQSLVTLIDFGMASNANAKTESSSKSAEFKGSLPFMSPEQTGRMNLTVDHRSDLYSLGIVFYEMLTGLLPFNASNAGELMHSHIAKTCLPVNSVDPSIPSIVSDIVDKLLSKDPKSRYQSAFSLLSDLERCQAQFMHSKKIKPFELALNDFTGLFRLPTKCLGRDQELNRMKEAYGRVENGASEVIHISGDAGVGKTFLINEFKNKLQHTSRSIICGTFDVYNRNIPYSAITVALKVFIDQLLQESTVSIQHWKTIFLQYIGSKGALITTIIPEFELIIGKQDALIELGPKEAQVRLNHTVLLFLKALSSLKNPVVIVIDNLQWADVSSINLLNFICSEKDLSHLLFIFSYRANDEVALEFQKSIVQKSTIHEKLEVTYFSQETLPLLISSSLACNSDDIKELADLVFEKTGGNPLFALQFIKLLNEENLLTFNFKTKKWSWKPDAIQEMSITDNVVRLMVHKISKLSESTKELLSFASCIGTRFNLKDLAIVASMQTNEVLLDLKPAITEHILVETDELLKSDKALQQGEVDISYDFLHDNLRQAANNLIPKKNKKLIGLQVGKLLLNKLSKPEVKEKIFMLADLLNDGFQYIKDEQEKITLCELNLLAGIKSKKAASYKSAIWYLSMGIGILPKYKWEKYFSLTLKLYLEATESEYLSTNFDRAELLANEILKYAHDIQTKIKVYELRILFYTAQNQYEEAVNSGIEALKMLDISLPDTNKEKDLFSQELAHELSNKGTPVRELINLPHLNDLHQLLVLRILSGLADSAHRINHKLFPAIITKMLFVSVKQGNSPFSALAYAWYGVLLSKNEANINKAYEFSELSIKMFSVFSNSEQILKIKYLLNVFVKHRNEPIKTSIKALQNVYKSSIETGDLESGLLSAFHYSNINFLTGKPLNGVYKNQAEYLNRLERYGLDVQNQAYKILSNTINSLVTELPIESQLKVSFELSFISGWIEQNNFFPVFNTYFYQTISNYFNEDYKSAVESAQLAEKYEDGAGGYYYIICYKFYYAMALIANYPTVDQNIQKEYLSKLNAIVQLFKKWSTYSPMNYLNKYALINAELSRISGDKFKAIEHYGIAIKEAKEQAYFHEEAIAYECEAMFYLSIDREDIAGVCIQKALDAYSCWGASKKSFLIKEKYKHLLIKEKLGSVDSIAIVNASQVLSQELRLEHLLSKLIKIVIENAGAEKGILIENKEDNLIIQAKGETKLSEVVTMQELAVKNSTDVPISIINYVARTLSPLVLNNACKDSLYHTDAYIEKNKVKSLLCLPIVLQGKLIGILYVENNLSTHVFTAGRLELLQTLSAQAAISIENARLYTDLEKNILEIIRKEEALRESEERFKSLVANLPGIVYRCDNDPEWTMHFISDEIAKVSGYPAEDFLENRIRSFSSIIYAEDRDRLDKTVEKAINKKEAYEVSYRIRHRDGTMRWVTERGRGVFNSDGQLINLDGAIFDVTERHQAEVALKESQVRYRCLFEDSPISLWEEDFSEGKKYFDSLKASGVTNFRDYFENHPEAVYHCLKLIKIIDVNKATLTLTKAKDKADLLAGLDKIFTSESLEVFREELIVLAEGGLYFASEADHSTINGDKLTVLIKLNVVPGYEKTLGKVLLSIQNISERKQAEEEINTLNLDLEKRVVERTSQLEVANKELEAFSYSVSHDLRAPLCSIGGFSQILVEDYSGKMLDEQGQDYLRRVNKAAKRMSQLIDDMLKLSRVSRGELKKQEVNLSKIAHETISALIEADPKRKVNFKTQDDIIVCADRGLLRIVLVNLLGNAWKFTSKRSAASIEFGLMQEDDKPVFFVRDNGAGFDMKYAQKLFGAFQRLHDANEFQGTGIGLATIQRIIHRHGGKVWAESELGQETTFYFTIPK